MVAEVYQSLSVRICDTFTIALLICLYCLIVLYVEMGLFQLTEAEYNGTVDVM